MSNPVTESFRGKAQFVGCGMALDCIIYPATAIQDADFTQDYESEKVRDSRGAFCSERTTNAMTNAGINMKLVGDTQANARALNNVNAGGFLPMQQTVIISDPATGPALPAMMKGKFKVKSGTKVSIKNAACGDLALPLEQYQDTDQNDLMTSTPA